MHFIAAFMTGKRKVKYASEMPIFEIAIAQKMTKTKKALRASDDQ
jgi:hypothetical protein